MNSRLLNMCNIYGTPLYVYDLNVVNKHINILYKTLPKEVKVFYSLKANPSMNLLRSFSNNISGAEVSSEGELYTALKSGISADKIIFVGPGKSEFELTYAIENKILSIVVESFSELDKVNHMSSKIGSISRIAVRVNPKSPVDGARIKMGGSSKQFGIDEELLDEFIRKVHNSKNVILEGLHIYMGTQILDSETLVKNFQTVFAVAKKMQHNLSVDLKLIDFGGGFGIPYFKGDRALDMAGLENGLKEVFEDNKRYFDYKAMNIIVESGRFVVAESGYYLTKVICKKHSRGKTFIITDGGSNNHSSAAGIGRFARNNFPVEVIRKSEPSNTYDKEIVDIAGPLCTPTDILAQRIELPVVNEGDIICIPKSGAYGLSASMKDFLSHPHPAEVLIDGSKHKLIRRRGTKEDLLAGQIF